MIDPAHDFGKNTFHSLELTRRLGEMVDTGWPVLVSLSNKDFVGETLDLPVGRAADRHPRRDRGLRARRGPDLPRARGRRDPADRRHGVDDRRPPAAAAGDPGAAVTRRVVLVPGVLALLPEYAGIEDPVAELRAACLDAVGWLGADVTVLADAQGARVAEHLLRVDRPHGRRRRRTSSSATAAPGAPRRPPATSTSGPRRSTPTSAGVLKDGLWESVRAIDLDLARELWAERRRDRRGRVAARTSGARRSTTTTTRSAFSTG